MKRFRIACAAALVLAVFPVFALAQSQVLYAVSVRTYSDPSYRGIEGSLYRVDPETAASTLMAPLRLDGRASIGLDGLAVEPRSGEFFGITAPNSTLIPHSLVHVNPASGEVTLIGDLGVNGSDLSFDSDGTLFIWIPETSQAGKVDLKTGAVTKIGAPRERSATKGGFDIQKGKARIASAGGKGSLDTIDLLTGAVVSSVPLSGARYPELINGLVGSARGMLYAVNTNGAAPALADLVRIDEATGQIATIGPLPNDTDALTFGPAVGSEKSWDLATWRMVSAAVLAAFAAGAAIAALFLRRRR
jgi:hypothetical protein